MEKIKLSESKILELANMFLSCVVSISEFERICSIPADIILRIFRKDLYEINFEKAESVRRILDIPGYLQYTGYIKGNICYYNCV